MMPMFFFNVHNGGSHNDTVGDELPDTSAAWEEATTIAGQLLRDLDGNLKPGQKLSVEVTDEAAKPLYAIRIETESYRS